MNESIGIADAVRITTIPRASITRTVRAGKRGMSPAGGPLRPPRRGDTLVCPTLGATKAAGRRWAFNRAICEAIGAAGGNPAAVTALTVAWVRSLSASTSEGLERAQSGRPSSLPTKDLTP